ncbi:hypothetical protein ACTPEF_27385, partial [Clostridioides difficile]
FIFFSFIIHFIFSKVSLGNSKQLPEFMTSRTPYFPVTFFKTFDNDFRNNILNKNANFKTPQDVKEYFDSPCIMVGIKGQTK